VDAIERELSRSGTDPCWCVESAVESEAAELAALGVSAIVRRVPDDRGPTAEQATAVATTVQEMEEATLADLAAGRPNPMLLVRGRPAFESWGPLTKRAIALTNIYNVDATHLGSGIDPSIYRRALLTRRGRLRSASDLLAEDLGPERAARIVDHYDRFISTPIDDVAWDP
jgi:hypothetical protein